jgi:hypothetical protein
MAHEERTSELLRCRTQTEKAALASTVARPQWGIVKSPKPVPMLPSTESGSWGEPRNKRAFDDLQDCDEESRQACPMSLDALQKRIGAVVSRSLEG